MAVATGMLRLGFLSMLLALSLCVPAQSAVLSIDLGSEWLKVSVVNIKRGQSPITVAINEMSKRKTPALVAFQPGDRLIGEEAAGLVARYPDKVFSQVRDLIGKPYEYAKRVLDASYLPFDAVEDSRGGVSFKVDASGTVYTVEELLAMILGYAMKLAEFHSKLKIKDAVIAVPPYFGQAERKGLLQSAQLAGMNVISLVNEPAGAALQYGIDKDFANGSRHVVFYDMGSSSTYAALVYFSAYNAKELGKTVSINQFQVKDVSWNPNLGGQVMELRLVEYFADEFNKQLGNGVDVRKFPKAMAKLKKQVKRTKEILSANSIAPVSVESLYDDRDFRSTISREKFEELCEDLWEKSVSPIKEVLERSGLKAEDVSAVELIGGATRVPKLQAKLQEYLGRKELDKHLDADEAVVLGAALYAANLSDGIKLNRRLGMVDGSPYGFTVQFEGIDIGEDDSKKQSLAPRMKKLPSKMFKSIIQNKDFEVHLAYESKDLLPPGVLSPVFARYSVSGLADAAEKYSSKNLSSPVKANLHFSLSRSGVLSLDRADAVIEISEWVEVPKKNLTIANATADSNTTSAEDVSNDKTEETSETSSTDSGASNETISNTVDQVPADTGTERKLKKRTFRIPLKIIDKTTGPAVPLSKESFMEAQSKLESLDKKEAERRRTAELKNNLEGYIYATKEKIETSEEFWKISSSEERESFIAKLDEAQDWLYTDGEEALATAFEERLTSLKAIGDPMFFRLKEVTDRPAAVEQARQYLVRLQEIVQEWEDKKPWLPREKLDEIVKGGEDLKIWLEQKETEQKNAGFAKPAFTSDEVYDKLFTLQAKVAIVDKIPKPKPKVEKPKATEPDKEEGSPGPSASPVEESSSEDQSTDAPEGAADEETISGSGSESHDEL
ncbi:hypothetical protein MLD38_021544 [Melastoma candidum]|uniref:Uncharacterized protein n=1 Tax=Melastoma candidum TaxID=119954 RepID=A0ACB9QJT6_9MYRT|nr:hypothetical protein MLD38_021544 [Melastoma candidum]